MPIRIRIWFVVVAILAAVFFIAGVPRLVEKPVFGEIEIEGEGCIFRWTAGWGRVGDKQAVFFEAST